MYVSIIHTYAYVHDLHRGHQDAHRVHGHDGASTCWYLHERQRVVLIHGEILTTRAYALSSYALTYVALKPPRLKLTATRLDGAEHYLGDQRRCHDLCLSTGVRTYIYIYIHICMDTYVYMYIFMYT